ncbi:MAG: BlaI/MecI/CopY family transcriptional regulator [Chloroflexi bacterium]|nr:BlaI/MecI/CopY family transcriptional regulator [Chloroflexota bacterium]
MELDERVLDRLLGPLERAVMVVVWAKGQVTVRDVHDSLSRNRKIAYTTVLTVMSRLAQKKVLEREAQGTQHLYHARLSLSQFVDEASRVEVERLLADYGDLAITHFLHAASAVHPDLLDRLRRVAERARPEDTKKGPRRGQ